MRMDRRWLKGRFDEAAKDSPDGALWRVYALLACMECQRDGTLSYLPAYIQSQDENLLDPTEYGLTAEQQATVHKRLDRCTKKEIRRAYLFLMEDADLPEVRLTGERPVKLAIKFAEDGPFGACPFCGDKTRPFYGPDLFLSDGWYRVCETCGHTHAPEMMVG